MKLTVKATAKPSKYYAVAKGRKPGVYESWAECEEQIKGYSGASYKAFKERIDAFKFYEDAVCEHGYLRAEEPVTPAKQNKGIEIYVDGSYKDGQYAWGYVIYDNGVEVHADAGVGQNEAAAEIRNVAGELAATMRAVVWAKKNGIGKAVVHHDYQGISSWILGEWRAKNPLVKKYVEFMQPYKHMVEFVKVKGHSGNRGNERVDQVVKGALGIA